MARSIKSRFKALATDKLKTSAVGTKNKVSTKTSNPGRRSVPAY